VAAHNANFVIVACIVLIQYSSVTDGQTEDWQTPGPWLWRAKHSAVAGKRRKDILFNTQRITQRSPTSFLQRFFVRLCCVVIRVIHNSRRPLCATLARLNNKI